MASELVVPVVVVENVRPHLGSDNLELCDVLGYQMCIPKGRYKGGELAVYFPADTLVPAEWADKFGVRKFLKGKEQDRVGRVKLRGEPSFGLVVDIPPDQKWQEGDNVAAFYSCRKYEPPIRATAGDAAAYDEKIDPFVQKYTDIQNGRIFVDIFVNGEDVIVTEKLHGTNCKIGIVRDVDIFAGSMEVRRKRPRHKTPEGLEPYAGFDDDEIKRNTYWFPWSIKSVQDLVNDLCERNAGKVITVYGEVYGSPIQSLAYGLMGKIGFRVFDVSVDGRYLDWNEFKVLCDKHEVPVVPVLYRGPYSMDKMKELADGNTIMEGANHVREGIVVKPVKERTDPKIGRVVLKYIGTEYEMSKHLDMDTKDV